VVPQAAAHLAHGQREQHQEGPGEREHRDGRSDQNTSHRPIVFGLW
jgi:hypothetical protein